MISPTSNKNNTVCSSTKWLQKKKQQKKHKWLQEVGEGEALPLPRPPESTSCIHKITANSRKFNDSAKNWRFAVNS